MENINEICKKNDFVSGLRVDERDFDCLNYFDDAGYWNCGARESRTAFLKRYISEAKF